jgi:hypothetical protein
MFDIASRHSAALHLEDVGAFVPSKSHVQLIHVLSW